MSHCYHVHLSVYPLGSSEPLRVQAAVREAWVAPAWVNRRELRGAWLFEAVMEAPLPEGDDLAAFAESLSVAIWQRIGRYVKVVVDASREDTDDSRRRELGRTDYLKLMRAV
ncbi:hypothetical protein [Chitinimonas koreensis]|uniref:hypothetical protein n=1 Tax=Chitinimonas koreensis TaxID=356302 RepID=UPI0004261D7E|nr:hypothetical protein [Chitinimonas koreensis]QNM97489.1 hypothetical protein H9L41_04055 [Chitinimonas koreensis]